MCRLEAFVSFFRKILPGKSTKQHLEVLRDDGKDTLKQVKRTGQSAVDEGISSVNRAADDGVDAVQDATNRLRPT
eukprot:jgi/Mesen1/1888/ME000143S00937